MVEKPINDEYKIVWVINTCQTQKYTENTDWSILESYDQCQTYFSNFLKMFKNINCECMLSCDKS